MVFVSLLHFCKAIRPLNKKTQLQFIDTLRVNVKGGHGGNGLPKYGGIGGQGGCVYFVAKENVSLRNVMKRESKCVEAGDGEDSSKNRLLGRRGKDKEVLVPVGVSVVTDEGKQVGELNNDGDKCIAAGGGGGGCAGNNFLGHRGQERVVTLDLKLIADVGLVGFPNAGKSTLLKAISNASPKIAAYPFTTIRPQIGVVEYKDLRQVTVADLPGLIEGAHANIGMGYKFLKHIERTRLLVMVVDLFGFKLSNVHRLRTSLQNVFALNKELELYDKELIQRPCILLLNKIDENGADAEYEKIKDKLHDLEAHQHECPEELVSDKYLNFDEIIAISAKTNHKVDAVKEAIRNVLDKHALKQVEENIEKENERKKNRLHWY